MTPVAALASLFLLAQIMSINAAYTKLDATFTRQCPTGMLINILTVYVSGPACPLTLHVYIKKTPGAKLEGVWVKYEPSGLAWRIICMDRQGNQRF
jgi:hypothetical protein